ncbi:MAG: CDGSH iron-sulfur domain-containing protein, partial [Nanoarchaeota archaeon]
MNNTLAEEIPLEARTITLEGKKKYSFCTCGKSKKIPYCDESHKFCNEQQGTQYASLKIWPQEKTTVTLSSKNW